MINNFTRRYSDLWGRLVRKRIFFAAPLSLNDEVRIVAREVFGLALECLDVLHGPLDR